MKYSDIQIFFPASLVSDHSERMYTKLWCKMSNLHDWLQKHPTNLALWSILKKTFWAILKKIFLNICDERIIVEGLMLSFTFLFSSIVAGKLINQLHASPSMNKFQNKCPASLKYFNLSGLWMNSEINTWSKSEELILHWQYMNSSWLSADWNVQCKRSLKHYLLSN